MNSRERVSDSNDQSASIWKSLQEVHGELKPWSQISGVSSATGIIGYVPGDDQIAVFVADSLDHLLEQFHDEDPSLVQRGWYVTGELRELVSHSPLLGQPMSALREGRPILIRSSQEISRAPAGGGIYRIYLSAGTGRESVYIGQAVNLHRRLRTHEKTREWGWGASGISHIEVLPVSRAMGICPGADREACPVTVTRIAR